MNSTTVQAPTASGPTSKERAAPGAPGGWVRVDRSFLDARTTLRKRNGEPISGRERLMWAVLDGYCGPRPFCWPSTEELAAAYGCDVRTAFQILKEMDEDGIIRRVADGPKGKRIGIILLKRINPDSAEMVEQEVPSMIALLRDAIEDSLTRRRTLPFEAGIARKTAQGLRGKPRRDCAENRAFEKESLSFEKMESEKGGDEDGSIQRQRSGIAEPPTPLPPPAPPGQPASNGPALVAALAGLIGQAPAIAPAPKPAERPAPVDQAAPRVEAPVATESGEGLPPLTPTQEQFLKGLDADRRQRFEALPAARRRAMLGPLARVCDPIVMREHVRALSPPAPPPPPPPAATAELWARLPDAPPDWIPAAAEALVNDLGPERERRYRPAHLDLAGEVWRGKIPAEIVLDAYRQGMNPKSKVPGKVFAHALKAAGVRWEGSRP